MENSSIKLIDQGVLAAIDPARLVSEYITGMTLAFPVDRRFSGEECGEIASFTSRRLKWNLTRRRWPRVKVTVRNRKRGAQNYVEVVIKDGFTPVDH